MESDWEATRSATMAVQPPRVQNATSEFVGRAEKAARTGTAYEATLSPDRAYGQMAGIAATAKYAAAAANATRYAADAARKAGAQRAASRAEPAAEVAAWWADMAQDRAEHSTFAPYTVLRTARCARRAAAAARYAARASGPLGRFASGIVGLAVALLPAASRDRYAEEWRSDLCQRPCLDAQGKQVALTPGGSSGGAAPAAVCCWLLAVGCLVVLFADPLSLGPGEWLAAAAAAAISAITIQRRSSRRDLRLYRGTVIFPENLDAAGRALLGRAQRANGHSRLARAGRRATGEPRG